MYFILFTPLIKGTENNIQLCTVWRPSGLAHVEPSCGPPSRAQLEYGGTKMPIPLIINKTLNLKKNYSGKWYFKMPTWGPPGARVALKLGSPPGPRLGVRDSPRWAPPGWPNWAPVDRPVGAQLGPAKQCWLGLFVEVYIGKCYIWQRHLKRLQCTGYDIISLIALFCTHTFKYSFISNYSKAMRGNLQYLTL